MIGGNSIKGRNATVFPRFNREKSISAAKAGGWEVFVLALIQIRMWISLMSEKGPAVATKALAPRVGAR